MMPVWCKICGNLYYYQMQNCPFMRQLPLLFLLFLSTSIFSQSINLHTSPFTALDLAPRWRIGVEYDTQMDLAFSLDIGYGNDALQTRTTDRRRWDNNYYYLEFRPEIKLFLTSFKRTPNFRKLQQQRLGRYPANSSAAYISLEYFHSHLKNTFSNTNILLSSNLVVRFDEGRFHKIKNGGHFKIGIKHQAGRFVIDFSGGIGGTRRHKFYTDVKNWIPNYSFYPEAFDSEPFDFADKHEFIGTRSLVHATLNLRIGYAIWRKKL